MTSIHTVLSEIDEKRLADEYETASRFYSSGACRFHGEDTRECSLLRGCMRLASNEELGFLVKQMPLLLQALGYYRNCAEAGRALAQTVGVATLMFNQSHMAIDDINEALVAYHVATQDSVREE